MAAPFGAGCKAIYEKQVFASTFAFVFQCLQKLPPAAVGYRSRQFVITNHPFDVEVFNRIAGNVAFVYQFCGLLMNEIVATITDFFMDSSNFLPLPRFIR